MSCILNDHVKEVFCTGPEGNYFFGYYDKTPFDAMGKRLLCHHVRFHDRMPTINDFAEIVLWNLDTHTKQSIAQTKAFNWQQGSMLQWLGPDFNSRIIFNDRRNTKYVSIILDLTSGRERILPLPVYSVSKDGCWAVCINYERLFWCRPGYCYPSEGVSTWNKPIPEGDGVYLMNLDSGDYRTIITTKQLTEMKKVSSMESGDHYLENLLFSPNGDKFIFFHRWVTPDLSIYTRGYVSDRDGLKVKLLYDSGNLSHYNWRDNSTIVLTGRKKNWLSIMRQSMFFSRYFINTLAPIYRKIFRPHGVFRKTFTPTHYFIVDIENDTIQKISIDNDYEDGHPSFNPKWESLMLSDTYQDKNNYRHLFICDIKKKKIKEIGRFFSPPRFNDTPYRCDLHPRWDWQGNKICIDSFHTGQRQMHVFDISTIINELV